MRENDDEEGMNAKKLDRKKEKRKRKRNRRDRVTNALFLILFLL